MATYLLSIGIKDYDNGSIEPLYFCHNDAVEIYSLFSRTFGLGGNAVNLIGAVTADKIWQALDAIGKKIRSGDTFILFFAGHGGQTASKNDNGSQLKDQILLLHDVDLETVYTASPRGVISLSALKAKTNQWTGVSRIFILDACRSLLPERGATEAVFRNEAGLNDLVARDLLPNWRRDGATRSDNIPPLLILNATRDGQSAHELPGVGRGVMASALENVLEKMLRLRPGEDLWLDQSLTDAVGEQMRLLLSGRRQEQTPFLTPSNGRALLYRPPPADEAAAQADERLIDEYINGGGADNPDGWLALQARMQTAEGRRKCIRLEVEALERVAKQRREREAAERREREAAERREREAAERREREAAERQEREAAERREREAAERREREAAERRKQEAEKTEPSGISRRALLAGGASLLVAGGWWGWQKRHTDAAAASWQPEKTVIETPSEIYSVAVLADGRQALSGHWDNNIRLWDLAAGSLVRTFAGHDGYVSSVAVTPDGRYLLSGSDDKTVRQWSLSDGSLVRTFERHIFNFFTGHDGTVYSVAVTPDGRYALSGGGDKTLRLWPLQAA